jgi:hypothetical protein
MIRLVHRTRIGQYGRTAEVRMYNYTTAVPRDYLSTIYILFVTGEASPADPPSLPNLWQISEYKAVYTVPDMNNNYEDDILVECAQERKV